MSNINFVSLKGMRQQNEDQHDIVLNKDGNNKKINKINLYGVYDGHGGKLVSKFLKDNLKYIYFNPNTKYPLTKSHIIKEYTNLQKKLQTLPYANNSGSTSTVIVEYNINNKNYINVINVGDSRCVICRENLAMPLSKDHKPNWPEEKKRIESLGGVIKFDGHDYRICDLSVSRAFGDIDTTPYVTHIPDIFRYELHKNDKFIVLACDGLWDVMSNQDVVNFILLNFYDKNIQERKNRNINAAKKLGEYAINVLKSTDNITIIIIFL